MSKEITAPLPVAKSWQDELPEKPAGFDPSEGFLKEFYRMRELINDIDDVMHPVIKWEEGDRIATIDVRTEMLRQTCAIRKLLSKYRNEST